MQALLNHIINLTKNTYYLSVSYKNFLIILLLSCSVQFLIGQNIENIGQQDPFKVSGTIGGGVTFYNADGKTANREPFSWIIQGSPTFSIYGIEIPFSFTFSEQERDFRQPFNQFGLSPSYKWVTVHLAYRNIKWSDYSLAGHNFFGAGLELNPGKFRFGAVYGTFLKAIAPADNSSGTYQTPAFKRTGSAVKLGYGTEKNNADLIVFHAKDAANSIDITNLSFTLFPTENVVASIRTHQVFFDKLMFDAEFARSIFNPNLANPEITALNDPMLNVFSFLIKEKQGSLIGNAINAVLGFKEKTFEIKLKYNRVDPDFRSLGAYYFLTDIEKTTVEPRFKLWKNKLVIGGSYGIQKDNLSKSKNAQTLRNIYSANINFMPVQQYNLSANYTNYGITQKPGTQPINNQIEIAQVNQQLSVTQNISVMTGKSLHLLLLLWNYQNLSDDNSNTSQFSEFKSNILSPRYTYSYSPWQFTIGAGYNYSVFDLALGNTKNYGPSATMSKAFKKPRLNVSASYNYYKIEKDGSTDSKAFTLSFQSKYKIGKRHQFSGRFHINDGNVTGINPLNYSETKIDFGYVYSF